MKITCPDCATTYRVSPAALGPEGRDVKCARCGTRWHALPDPDTASIETELPEDADVEARAARQPAAAMAGRGDASPAEDEEDDSDGEPRDALEEDFAGNIAGDRGEDVFSAAAQPRDDGLEDEDDQAEGGWDAAKRVEPAALPVAAAAAEADGAAASAKPVDIESLARKPKIYVKPRSSEPVLGRLLAAVGQRARRLRPRRVVGTMMFFGAIALCALAVTFRTPIVARMPDLAGLFALAGLEVNLRGLEFRDLRTFREIEDGAIVLVIEGTIVNVEREAVPIPAVRLALRSEDAQEIYAWTMEPRLRRLDVGGTTRFRTRLSAPPDLAADIQVRFVERKERQVRLQ